MVKNKEPRLEWSDVFSGFSICLGFLLFLFALHLLTINTDGNTSSVLNTAFIIFTTIYTILVIFGFIGLITQLLRWVTWSINTPNWKKGK